MLYYDYKGELESTKETKYYIQVRRKEKKSSRKKAKN